MIDLLTEDVEREIPVMHNFSVDICVRGIHYYNVHPAIGVMLDFFREDDPISLIHDQLS